MNLMIFASLLLGIFFYCSLFVGPYKGLVIINRITGSLRSIGSGWNWIWPWELVSGEEISLKKNSYSFTGDFETQDKATNSLKISWDEVPHSRHLTSYRAFDEDTRIQGITERLRSVLSIEIRKFKNRTEVMDNMKKIGEDAKKIFEETLSENGERLEIYYGTNLAALVVADVELPKELRDAKTRQEAVKKENETRKLEMRNLKQMAADLVSEGFKRTNVKMPFEKAMEIIQLQFGKGNIQKDIKVFGLDKNTLEVFEKIAIEMANARR